jgi:glycosyltransferase involved in cell wall biosynthesis
MLLAFAQLNLAHLALGHVTLDVSLGCAALAALIFASNLFLYRQPPRVSENSKLPAVSVVIPARNEEQSIAAAVASVLASTHIDMECLVLDDSSTDRTAALVQQFAARDKRVRLVSVPPLPAKWNGKQHACWHGAQQATHPTLLFLDADVRLKPEAIARMALFLQSSHSALVSGIPRQITGTWMEKLLLPLIDFLLLCYLPLAGMRWSRAAGFAAGCGQFLMVDREAYFASGGHSAIPLTMHDGLQLPRLLRHRGYRTALADLTQLASCRMYRSAREVWYGLGKNATEGIATPANILPFTLLLLFGQVIPIFLLLAAHSHAARSIALAAVALSYLPRLICALRFRQSWLGAIFHPVGVTLLLVLQWWAFARKMAGTQAIWKQRAYSVG